METNPSPVSNTVTVYDAQISLTEVPVSPDSQVGKRNIYATGGTLGQAYLVATINDNQTTTVTVTDSDADATNLGIVMPTANDGPPLASGMVGPYFSRLIAFSTADHPNRIFWTDPGKQYWPGASDPAVGNWADVGEDGERILWCTIHPNVLVIYKERSIWRLVGDPDGGYLEQVDAGIGLINSFAVCKAGPVDYFVGPSGLYRFNGDRVEEITDSMRPLFTTKRVNAGPLTPPGSVQEAGVWPSSGFSYYDVSIGFAVGKLYVSYGERSNSDPGGAPILIFNGERWSYFRSSLIGNENRIRGFFFDGIGMVALGGDGSTGYAWNIDDFSWSASQEFGGVPIRCVYQGHYEDCGIPDTPKMWLEIVVDCELDGDTATILIGYDNGTHELSQIGTITGSGRRSVSFALGSGVMAKNISVAVDCTARSPFAVHNVYLYYYEEARAAMSAASLPTDLGSAKVKQCKELQLDVDASGGPVAVSLSSDLPGNALAVRQTPAVPKTQGRALLKFPFPTAEGYIWRLALAANSGAFRVYHARLLMRPIGVYVEAYESAAGFVWDSMEQTFESGLTHIPRGSGIALATIPVKRAREISLEIETFGGDVSVTLLSDLPGNAQAVRFTANVNTASAGRRSVRIPLPAGHSAAIEGRAFRLQLSGNSKFILYGAALEILAVGVYVEAYEAAAGAVWDSREVDLGTPGVKDLREIELDLETSGSVSVEVSGDTSWASIFQVTGSAQRQKIIVQTTGLEGRLLRLLLSGQSSYILYGARLKVRPYGFCLTSADARAGLYYDSTELDLGSEAVKQLRELELDIYAMGTCTATLYTDMPGGGQTVRVTATVAALAQPGRTTVLIPLPQDPQEYLYGRRARLVVRSETAGFKLFGARLHARPVGVYVDSSEAAGGARWDSAPSDLGDPASKTFGQIRFEMDSDGTTSVTVFTDLPGEGMASRGTFTLTASSSGRHWATVPLPEGVEGRSIRAVVSGAAGFRIYRFQVMYGRLGRYLCGVTAAGVADATRALEYDFESERVKAFKKIELDLRTDQAVTVTVFTEQPGGQSARFSAAVNTAGARRPVVLMLPPGVRGRFFRVSVGGGIGRVFRVRAWARAEVEAKAEWTWVEFPVEATDVLPAWKDIAVPETPAQFTWASLPVPTTPSEWSWVPLPVAPTDPQWMWAKVLSVEETPDTWDWVEMPISEVRE